MKRVFTAAGCALGLLTLAVGAQAQETVITSGRGVTVRTPNGQVTRINNNGVVTETRRGVRAVRGMGRTINGNGLRQTFSAADGPVIINGNRNTLTIRGACPRLVVNGNNNNVYATRVGAIETSGNENRVRYASSPRRGGRATISDLGTNNRISRQ